MNQAFQGGPWPMEYPQFGRNRPQPGIVNNFTSCINHQAEPMLNNTGIGPTMDKPFGYHILSGVYAFNGQQMEYIPSSNDIKAAIETFAHYFNLGMPPNFFHDHNVPVDFAKRTNPHFMDRASPNCHLEGVQTSCIPVLAPPRNNREHPESSERSGGEVLTQSRKTQRKNRARFRQERYNRHNDRSNRCLVELRTEDYQELPCKPNSGRGERSSKCVIELGRQDQEMPYSSGRDERPSRCVTQLRQEEQERPYSSRRDDRPIRCVTELRKQEVQERPRYIRWAKRHAETKDRKQLEGDISTYSSRVECRSRFEPDDGHNKTESKSKQYLAREKKKKRHYCHVCLLHIGDHKSFVAHLAGRRHRNKKMQSLKPFVASQNSIELRLDTLEGEVTFHKHLSVEGDPKSISLVEDMQIANSTPVTESNGILRIKQAVPSQPEKKDHTGPKLSQNECQHIEEGKPKIQKQAWGYVKTEGSHHLSLEKIGKTTRCQVCSFEIIGRKNYVKHLLGRRHRKNIMKHSMKLLPVVNSENSKANKSCLDTLEDAEVISFHKELDGGSENISVVEDKQIAISTPATDGRKGEKQAIRHLSPKEGSVNTKLSQKEQQQIEEGEPILQKLALENSEQKKDLCEELVKSLVPLFNETEESVIKAVESGETLHVSHKHKVTVNTDLKYHGNASNATEIVRITAEVVKVAEKQKQVVILSRNVHQLQETTTKPKVKSRMDAEAESKTSEIMDNVKGAEHLKIAEMKGVTSVQKFSENAGVIEKLKVEAKVDEKPIELSKAVAEPETKQKSGENVKKVKEPEPEKMAEIAEILHVLPNNELVVKEPPATNDENPLGNANCDEIMTDGNEQEYVKMNERPKENLNCVEIADTPACKKRKRGEQASVESSQKAEKAEETIKIKDTVQTSSKIEEVVQDFRTDVGKIESTKNPKEIVVERKLGECLKTSAKIEEKVQGCVTDASKTRTENTVMSVEKLNEVRIEEQSKECAQASSRIIEKMQDCKAVSKTEMASATEKSKGSLMVEGGLEEIVDRSTSTSKIGGILQDCETNVKNTDLVNLVKKLGERLQNSDDELEGSVEIYDEWKIKANYMSYKNSVINRTVKSAKRKEAVKSKSKGEKFLNCDGIKPKEDLKSSIMNRTLKLTMVKIRTSKQNKKENVLKSDEGIEDLKNIGKRTVKLATAAKCQQKKENVINSDGSNVDLKNSIINRPVKLVKAKKRTSKQKKENVLNNDEGNEDLKNIMNMTAKLAKDTTKRKRKKDNVLNSDESNVDLNTMNRTVQLMKGAKRKHEKDNILNSDESNENVNKPMNLKQLQKIATSFKRRNMFDQEKGKSNSAESSGGCGKHEFEGAARNIENRTFDSESHEMKTTEKTPDERREKDCQETKSIMPFTSISSMENVKFADVVEKSERDEERKKAKRLKLSLTRRKMVEQEKGQGDGDVGLCPLVPIKRGKGAARTRADVERKTVHREPQEKKVTGWFTGEGPDEYMYPRCSRLGRDTMLHMLMLEEQLEKVNFLNSRIGSVQVETSNSRFPESKQKQSNDNKLTAVIGRGVDLATNSHRSTMEEPLGVQEKCKDTSVASTSGYTCTKTGDALFQSVTCTKRCEEKQPVVVLERLPDLIVDFHLRKMYGERWCQFERSYNFRRLRYPTHSPYKTRGRGRGFRNQYAWVNDRFDTQPTYLNLKGKKKGVPYNDFQNASTEWEVLSEASISEDDEVEISNSPVKIEPTPKKVTNDCAIASTSQSIHSDVACDSEKKFYASSHCPEFDGDSSRSLQNDGPFPAELVDDSPAACLEANLPSLSPIITHNIVFPADEASQTSDYEKITEGSLCCSEEGNKVTELDAQSCEWDNSQFSTIPYSSDKESLCSEDREIESDNKLELLVCNNENPLSDKLPLRKTDCTVKIVSEKCSSLGEVRASLDVPQVSPEWKVAKYLQEIEECCLQETSDSLQTCQRTDGEEREIDKSQLKVSSSVGATVSGSVAVAESEVTEQLVKELKTVSESETSTKISITLPAQSASNEKGQTQETGKVVENDLCHNSSQKEQNSEVGAKANDGKTKPASECVEKMRPFQTEDVSAQLDMLVNDIPASTSHKQPKLSISLRRKSCCEFEIVRPQVSADSRPTTQSNGSADVIGAIMTDMNKLDHVRHTKPVVPNNTSVNESPKNVAKQPCKLLMLKGIPNSGTRITGNSFEKLTDAASGIQKENETLQEQIHEKAVNSAWRDFKNNLTKEPIEKANATASKKKMRGETGIADSPVSAESPSSKEITKKENKSSVSKGHKTKEKSRDTRAELVKWGAYNISKRKINDYKPLDSTQWKKVKWLIPESETVSHECKCKICKTVFRQKTNEDICIRCQTRRSTGVSSMRGPESLANIEYKCKICRTLFRRTASEEFCVRCRTRKTSCPPISNNNKCNVFQPKAKTPKKKSMEMAVAQKFPSSDNSSTTHLKYAVKNLDSGMQRMTFSDDEYEKAENSDSSELSLPDLLRPEDIISNNYSNTMTTPPEPRPTLETPIGQQLKIMDVFNNNIHLSPSECDSSETAVPKIVEVYSIANEYLLNPVTLDSGVTVVTDSIIQLPEKMEIQRNELKTAPFKEVDHPVPTGEVNLNYPSPTIFNDEVKEAENPKKILEVKHDDSFVQKSNECEDEENVILKEAVDLPNSFHELVSLVLGMKRKHPDTFLQILNAASHCGNMIQNLEKPISRREFTLKKEHPVIEIPDSPKKPKPEFGSSCCHADQGPEASNKDSFVYNALPSSYCIEQLSQAVSNTAETCSVKNEVDRDVKPPAVVSSCTTSITEQEALNNNVDVEADLVCGSPFTLYDELSFDAKAQKTVNSDLYVPTAITVPTLGSTQGVQLGETQHGQLAQQSTVQPTVAAPIVSTVVGEPVKTAKSFQEMRIKETLTQLAQELIGPPNVNPFNCVVIDQARTFQTEGTTRSQMHPIASAVHVPVRSPEVNHNTRQSRSMPSQRNTPPVNVPTSSFPVMCARQMVIPASGTSFPSDTFQQSLAIKSAVQPTPSRSVTSTCASTNYVQRMVPVVSEMGLMPVVHNTPQLAYSAQIVSPPMKVTTLTQPPPIPYQQTAGIGNTMVTSSAAGPGSAVHHFKQLSAIPQRASQPGNAVVSNSSTCTSTSNQSFVIASQRSGVPRQVVPYQYHINGPTTTPVRQQLANQGTSTTPAIHNRQYPDNRSLRNLPNPVVPKQLPSTTTIAGGVNVCGESRNPAALSSAVPQQQYRNTTTYANGTMTVRKYPVASVTHHYSSGGSAHLGSLQRMSGSPTWFPPPPTSTMPSWHQPQSKECANCGQGGATVPCQGCQKMFYCSDYCRKAYWPSHCYVCI